jgi:tetratricopeptide (TPR) repeat protein
MKKYPERQKSFQGIGSILFRCLPEDTANREVSIEQRTYHWNLVVGREVSQVTAIDKMTSKTLYITVAGTEWLKPLESLRQNIISEIKQHPGFSQLTRIVFRQGNVPHYRDPKVAHQKSLLPKPELGQIPDEFKGSLAMIKDNDLKEVLTRLSKKINWSLAAVGLLVFISNCTTANTQLQATPEGPVSLASSYAVKGVTSTNGKSSVAGSRDPRSYYHYLMALKAERHNLFEEAAAHYNEVIRFDPAAEDIYEHLAVLYLRSGQIEKSYQTAMDALNLYPDSLALSMILGDILSARGESERALSHYQKITQLSPHSGRALMFAALMNDRLGRFQEAKEQLQKMVLVEPTNPLGRHYLARQLIRSGDMAEAEKNLQRAVALRPNFFQAREHLAWVLEIRGKFREATKEYNLLLKLNPENKYIRSRLDNIHAAGQNSSIAESPEEFPDYLIPQPNVHSKLANVFYEQAMYRKALDEFQIVAIKEPDSKAARLLMARIYEILGRTDKSIEQFELLRILEPGSVEVLLYLGRLYSMEGQFEETIELVSRAIDLEPENDALYHSMSLAHMASENYGIAVENMRKAIEINPNKDSYYFELGALQEKSGQFKAAIKNMEQAIEINPMHSNAHNFLGYMYATEGTNLDKALEHLKKALSIQPRNGYFLDSLGWIYFKKGESPKALREIKRAMVYTSPDPVLYDHLGDVQFSLKNYREARGAWKTSLSLTRIQKVDLDGEMPDPKKLEEKIQDIKKYLAE